MMDCPSRSTRICAELDFAFPVLRAQSAAIWSSSNVRELYPVYLRTMHMVVRSAVPLMQAALDQAKRRAPADPVCIELADYYGRHIKEELGHDRWLIEDLAATGADPSAALNRIPPPAVAALVGAQYYWLNHYHPVALLGHIIAMENYHPPAGFAAFLEDATGYPRSAFRTISRHEVLDVHHRRDLLEFVDHLPVGIHHEHMITISGLHTLQSGVEVLAEIHGSPAPANAN